MDTPEKRWLNALFGNVTWCTSDQQNNSSEGFFVWSITVKSWIWMAIHCNLIQLFFYSRNTEGCRSEAKLPQIRPKLVFSSVNTAFTLLARWASKGVINKKASTYPQANTSCIPNSKYSFALLQAWWQLRCLMITQNWMLCWSVVQLKSKANI